MDTYTLDDAIELLCAYRDQQRRKEGGVDARETPEEEVHVRMQLVAADAASKVDDNARPTQAFALGSVARSSTVERLEQWWSEGSGATGLTYPTSEREKEDPNRLLLTAAAHSPSRPSATASHRSVATYPSYVPERASNADPRSSSPTVFYANSGYGVRPNASTYEVSPPPAQRVPQTAYYYPNASAPDVAPSPHTEPPPQAQRSIVVRAQPNMGQGRTGQNGIAWVVH